MRILWLSLGMPKIPVAGALTHWPASARHSLGSPAFPRFVHGGADARGPTPCTHGVDDRRGAAAARVRARSVNEKCTPAPALQPARASRCARRPRRVEVGLPRWRAIYNSAREDAAPRRYPPRYGLSVCMILTPRASVAAPEV